MQLATLGIVPVYFKKHANKLYPWAVTAFSAGVLITPVLIEHLIETTSYTYAMLIEAAIFGLTFPAALIFRGPCHSSGFTIEKTVNAAKNVVGIKDDGEVNAAYLKETEENGDKSCGSSYGDTKLELGSADLPCPESTSSDKTSIQTTDKKVSMPSSSLRLIIRSHFVVLKEPVFVLYLIYIMCFSLGDGTFYALAVDYVTNTRSILDLNEAALGMTLTGIGGLVSSSLLIVISHWSFDNALLNIITVLVTSAVLLCMSVVYTVPQAYVLFSVFGVGDGVFAAQMAPLLKYQFGYSEDFTIRLSYAFFVVGIGSTLGPLSAGYIGTAIGMQYVFYFLGGSTLLSVIILTPYWLTKRIVSIRTSSESQ